MKRTALLVLLAAAVAAPAASAEVGPDYVTSDNVTLVNRIKTVGDGVGARVVGPYLYVTTTKSLSIFDIRTDPANPKQVGLDTMDVEFENEEVPTNGRILGISGQIGCADPLSANITNDSNNGSHGVGSESTGCLTTYDVSDPANIKKIKSIAGAGQHTSTCLYDCQWIYGSTGAITDNRDPANAKVVGDWRSTFDKGYFRATCHHLREIQPGIILGSCQPLILMSVRPEDGGSIMKPAVLDTGNNQDNRFIHSGRWPNAGTDKFVLIGGETNFKPTCDDTRGAFMVWDASDVIDGQGGFIPGRQFKLLSELRPRAGTYTDGYSAYHNLGCSVHWFQEHPTFHDGGLVALAEYEDGTRFVQILPNGKIVEQGFFLPLGGATSAPHWNPYDPHYVYSIDYERGVDVLKYTGSTYVPDASGSVPAQPGTTPGTADQAANRPSEGRSGASQSAPCAAASGFEAVTARGSGRGVRLDGRLRAGRSFDVTIYQASRGRSLLGEHRVARFTGKREAFTWRASGLRDGYYLARFSTTAGGHRDVRTITLQRHDGRFAVARPFEQPTPCGAFSAFSLSSPVFGGTSGRSLRISYRLPRRAARVTVEALVGSRVVRRLTGGGESGRTYRFALPAGAVERGSLVRIRATITESGPVATASLYARRL